MEVFTAQFRSKEKDRVDITVKSGIKAFAPTWKMVMDIKQGKITEQEYIDEYYRILESCFMDYRHEWEDLLGRDRAVLVCFCPKGAFCHRVLLAKFLEENFKDVVYKGEL